MPDAAAERLAPPSMGRGPGAGLDGLQVLVFFNVVLVDRGGAAKRSGRLNRSDVGLILALTAESPKDLLPPKERAKRRGWPARGA